VDGGLNEGLTRLFGDVAWEFFPFLSDFGVNDMWRWENQIVVVVWHVGLYI